MSDIEKKVLLKLLQDNKEMKKDLDYLIEANNLLLETMNKLLNK